MHSHPHTSVALLDDIDFLRRDVKLITLASNDVCVVFLETGER